MRGLGADALTPPPATLSDLRHLFRGRGGEPLRRYAERFRNVASRVPEVREDTIVLDFLSSARHPRLERELQARVVRRVEDLWMTVERHSLEEDAGAPTGTPTGSSDSEHFPGCACEGADDEDESRPPLQRAGATCQLEIRGPSPDPYASFLAGKRGPESAHRRPFRPPTTRWTYGPGRRWQGPGGKPGKVGW